MAGAGRAIVTWLTAKIKDAALLEFLGVAPDDLILRKGLIDTTMLNNRWGRKLKLFKDGEKVLVTLKIRLAANDLLLFSWAMSLISAALEAALSTSHYQDTITELVLKLFDNHPSEEHLRYELDAHKEGWRSTATVNLILDRARQEWEHLAQAGEHLMGNIPRADSPEILRLLIWITKGGDNRFYTPSSDVFCLASVLQVIGIDRLRTFKADQLPEPQFDEQHLVVVLKADAVGSMVKDPHVVRKGMPIPLGQTEEVISFWPYRRRKFENPLQEDFMKGMRAARGLKFRLDQESEIPHTKTTTNQTKTDLYYEISSTIPETSTRLRGYVESIARWFFPLVTDETAEYLKELATNWDPVDPAWETKKAICEDKHFLGRLQSFVMGYYYAALKPLIDTSQLSTQEAFGSWGWWDYEVLAIVKDLKFDTPKASTGPIRCWRFGLMKVMAYLFAGAELELIRRLDNRATGVIAKLCLFTASMLGNAISSEEASKFYLLDIDGSCIPNSQGIVISGRRSSSVRKSVTDDMIQRFDHKIQLEGRSKDFTVHIEPDWANDKQTCLVTFRDNGRIVQRMSPADCDAAVVLCDISQEPILISQPITEGVGAFIIDIDRDAEEEMCLITLDKFHGGEIITRSSDVWPAWNNKPFLIPTRNLPKARMCLKAMYLNALEWVGHTPRYPYQLPPLLKGSFVLYDNEAKPIIFA